MKFIYRHGRFVLNVSEVYISTGSPQLAYKSRVNVLNMQAGDTACSEKRTDIARTWEAPRLYSRLKPKLEAAAGEISLSNDFAHLAHPR